MPPCAAPIAPTRGTCDGSLYGRSRRTSRTLRDAEGVCCTFTLPLLLCALWPRPIACCCGPAFIRVLFARAVHCLGNDDRPGRWGRSLFSSCRLVAAASSFLYYGLLQIPTSTVAVSVNTDAFFAAKFAQPGEAWKGRHPRRHHRSRR